MIMLSTNKDFKEGNHYFLHERIFYGIFSLNKAKKVKKTNTKWPINHIRSILILITTKILRKTK